MSKIQIVAVIAALAAGSMFAAEPLEIGRKAPGFSLVNAVDGETVAMTPDAGGPKVVIFTCNLCPYASAFESRMIEIANRFGHRGIRFYAVNPNDDARYPGESLSAMKARAVENGYPFPYLKDGDSSVARAYGARVTPHVFVIDGDGTLRYRGYIDDSAKPAERKTTGLTDALNAMTNGRDIPNTVTREFGCAIKWKGGEE